MGFFKVEKPAPTRLIDMVVSTRGKSAVLAPNRGSEVLLPLTNSV
jgi:hypothetical protein